MIVSIGEQMPIIKIISTIIVYIGKGLGDAIFTPYIWFVFLLVIIVMKTDALLTLAKKLSLAFEEIWGIKFRNPSPEEQVDIEKLADTFNSSEENNEINRRDVNFYRELLIRNKKLIIGRFLLYALDQPGMPSNFTLSQLAEWTFGREALHKMISENTLQTLIYPVSLLIQTGVLEGTFKIDNETDEIIFESVRVNPSAHLALEQLMRMGYQMTPQVKID